MRSPVACSDSNTASSRSRSRAAKAFRPAWMVANFSPAVSPAISELVTIAPALIIGFNGRPVASSRLIALKGSPLGSRPTWRVSSASPDCSSTRANTKGFDTDWIVNAVSLSPASCTAPLVLTRAMPSASGSARVSSGMYDASSPSVRDRAASSTARRATRTGPRRSGRYDSSSAMRSAYVAPRPYSTRGTADAPPTRRPWPAPKMYFTRCSRCRGALVPSTPRSASMFVAPQPGTEVPKGNVKGSLQLGVWRGSR